MGKIMIIICTILLSVSYSAQNVRLTYEVSFKPKLNDSLKKNEQLLLQIDKDKNVSFFASKLSSENISLNSKIYKDFKKQTFRDYVPVATQFYHTEYIFIPDWKLSYNTKTVLGYKCRSAEINFGGREWVAWYAEDIPFQDGPYKFYGLPGLILEIFSKDGDYKFTAITLEKEQATDIALPTSTLLNVEQLTSLKQETIKNPAAQFTSRVNMLKNSNIEASVRFDNVEITNKDVEERMKKKFWDFLEKYDNPIEKGHIWTN